MFSFHTNGSAKTKIVKIWQEYLKNKTEKDYLSIYIHVPYCTQKCRYCEYSSKVTCTGIDDSCVDYLEEQFKFAAEYLDGEPIKALNFGGGTPNTLSASQLDRILQMIPAYWNLKTGDDYELGFEFHPYHLTSEHLKVLKNSYINRASMGVQTFDREIAQLENRLYVPRDRIAQICYDVRPSIKVVNIDLLAGLFNQTSEILIDDVNTLLTLGVDALTIYELQRIRRTKHKNKESERGYITKLLLDVYAEYQKVPHPGYRYVGTTPQDGFSHCNRFYNLASHQFKYTYNPAPQGYNSVLAFSLDDQDVLTYPYSHFTPINRAYQRLSGNVTLFYSLKERANSDRPWWGKAFNVRSN